MVLLLVEVGFLWGHKESIPEDPQRRIRSGDEIYLWCQMQK